MKKNLHAILIVCCMSSFLFSLPAFAQVSRVDIGKSFANVSRLNGGGTFSPGDTIEIRVTVAVIKVGTTNIIVDSVQVFDAVPAKTTYLAGSMRIATNQGLTWKGPFTEAQDTDAGKNVGGNIVFNLGTGANGTKGGRIKADSSRPSFYNTTCIMMACYRVRINPSANFGDTIFIGGSAKYRKISPTPVAWTNTVFPQYKILLFQENNYCTNGTNISAASDSLGTFASGTTQNRATALAFSTTYTKQNITTGQPSDYSYSIVNNSSPSGSTNVNATMPEGTANHRVFGLWDICGDHTGATNTAIGNPPAASGSRKGYFVTVNASYNTDIAYQETLVNLCPNTYYEFSAWYRNMCPRCSCDSTGKGSGTAGFKPFITTTGNDSSGVRPNLTFEVDGLAYFSTGEIKYDRIAPWKRYGFSFKTRPGQTTAAFTIRNNSPGGGGNDWAIDDIKVAHCGPSLTMNYNPYVLGCKEAPFEVYLRDTIRFAFNSYVYFKWQKSNVGGTVWTDMTGPGTSGVGTPVLVNGLYEYVTALPVFLATGADSGRYFRVTVATTAGNLASTSCSFNDANRTMIRAITCGLVLHGDFTQFKGILADKKGNLVWTTTGEENLKHYEIEKSYDGINFEKISVVNARNISLSSYNYTDPELINGNVYYRLKMVDTENKFKYSHVILISNELAFEVKNVQNPFAGTINTEIIVPKDGITRINLFNDKGQLLRSYQENVKKGINKLMLESPASISTGIYFISIEFNNESFKRKLFKK